MKKFQSHSRENSISKRKSWMLRLLQKRKLNELLSKKRTNVRLRSRKKSKRSIVVAQRRCSRIFQKLRSKSPRKKRLLLSLRT